MGKTSREEWQERTTGQVFYLHQDDATEKWIVDRFIGGPEVAETVSPFDTRPQAIKGLEEHDCEQLSQNT